MSTNRELRERRRERLRFQLRRKSEGRPRLSVFRSGKNIYAQVIDDSVWVEPDILMRQQVRLASISSSGEVSLTRLTVIRSFTPATGRATLRNVSAVVSPAD